MILKRLVSALALAAVCAVTGCAIPAGVDPLPYFAEDDSGNEVQTPQLCVLYYRYGFLEGGVENCNRVGWKLKELTADELKSDEYRSRRNELQHAILSMATNACGDYRKRLTARSEGFMVSTTVLALFLSAGATVATNTIAKELAAGATAFSGISQLMEKSYTNDLENTQLGIELARTRVFRNVLDGQKDDLLEYPVSRAINDAKRYHGVCNRADGSAQASRALSGQIQQLSGGGDQNEEAEPTDAADE